MKTLTIEELTEALILKWSYQHPEDIHKVIRGVRREGKAFARKLLITLINQTN